MPGIRSQFSKDFIFGAATAAYQIEGSKFGGCGESIWDHFAKNGGTENGDNGSFACDHFHRFEEDLDLLVDAGFDAYRFSFSWSRLFPDGKNLNIEGLDFYKQLLDAINSRGLRPFRTIPICLAIKSVLVWFMLIMKHNSEQKRIVLSGGKVS